MEPETVVITGFTCKVKISGISIKGKIPVTSVQMRGSVNDLPMISLTIYPNNGTSKISPNELIQLAKECQAQVLKGLSSTNPNVEIEIKMNGKGIASDNYDLKAILYGVDLHMDTNTSSIYVTIKATSPDVLLNCIDLSIYTKNMSLDNKIKSLLSFSSDSGSTIWAATLNASADNNYKVSGKPISRIMRDMVQTTMNRWGSVYNNIKENLSEQRQKIIESIHEKNQEYIQSLYSFLKASDDTSTLLDGVSFNDNPATVKGVLTGIENALYYSGASPLHAIMGYLTSNFGLWYSPNLHGNMQGKIKNQPFLADAPGSNLDLCCTSVDVAINQDQVRPPTGQVIMSASTINTVSSVSLSLDANRSSIFVAYPVEKAAGGVSYSLCGPSWLIAETGRYGDVTLPNSKYDRDPKEASKQNKEGNKEAVTVADTANSKILNYLAKKEFYRSKFQNSLLVVDTVINTDITTEQRGLGDFFTVKNRGSKIGNAVLSSVQHTFAPNTLTTQAGFTMLQL